MFISVQTRTFAIESNLSKLVVFNRFGSEFLEEELHCCLDISAYKLICEFCSDIRLENKSKLFVDVDKDGDVRGITHERCANFLKGKKTETGGVLNSPRNNKL